MKAESQMTQTARNAYYISLGMAFLTLAAFAGIIYGTLTVPVPTPTPWQIYVAPALPLPAFVGALLGVWYSRQNKPVQAGNMVIGGLLITTLLVPTIAARRSAYLAIVTTAIAVSAATMTMAGTQTNRIIRVVVAVNIVVVFIDLFYPFSRLPSNNITPVALIVLSAGAAIFTILAVVQFNTFQLQTKLLVLFALVPGLIITAIGAFFIFTINSQLLQQVQTATIDDLAAKKITLTGIVADTEEDVRYLSQSAALTEYLRVQATAVLPEETVAARRRLEAEFLAFAQSRQIYDQVRFIDANGQEIVRISSPATGQTTAVASEDLQNVSGRYYFEESIARSADDIYISSHGLNVEQEQIEEPYKPIIRFGVPVVGNRGKAGVVLVDVTAEPLLAALANTGYQTFLVDQDGYYLFHPDADKRWSAELEAGVTLEQDVPALPEQLSGNLSGITDVEIETDYYAFTPISLADEAAPHWTLINYVPSEVLWAPINDILAPIQAVMAIALLLTPLLAIFVSNSIGMPIARITRAAQQVADNKLSVDDLNISRQDELGTLADAFMQMTQRLRNLVDSLEARVTERTRDLVLAAEVGSRIAQVHNVGELLSEAVEIIRSRFDLYYTQIYLVEGDHLVLHAGTGSVGSDLLERQFRLPVGPGSINGTAAVEKRPIIVADTATSPLFLPNPLLPDTRSEMSVPLMIGDHVVGILNLQSARPNMLTQDNLPAFEALAGQLAIAIENARLFTETQQARAEIEAQARVLLHQGWDNYLDGIHRHEFVGYRYADAETHALSPQEVADGNGRHYHAPITIGGESIGSVNVGALERSLSPADQEMLQVIAQQVGQRLENLRLLSEAEQYRLEAEEAVRRLTKQKWEAFREGHTFSGFVYEQAKVKPLSTDEAAETSSRQPSRKLLRVRGEAIGYLEVDEAADDEMAEVTLTAVSEQLSQHIENLRLTQLTEERAAQLTLIDQVAQAISRQVKTEEIIETIYQQIPKAFDADAFHLGLYNVDTNTLDYPLLVEDGNRMQQSSIPLHPDSNTSRVIHNDEPVLRNLTPTEVAEIKRTQPDYLIGDRAGQVTASLIFVPLHAGQRVFGVLSVQSYQFNAFTQSDLTLLNGIANYVAVGLENARLFEQRERALAQVQRRSAELALINRAISDVAATLDLRESMQIITERLSEAIGAEQIGIALLNEDQEHLTVVAEKSPKGTPGEAAIGIQIPVKGNPSTEQVLATRQTLIVEDAQNSPLTAPIHAEMRMRGIETLIIIPMIAGSEVMGTVGIDFLDPDVTVTQEQVRLAETMVLQAATAAQKARLFEQTQDALSETAALYQASAELNEARTYKDVLHAIERHTILGARAQQIGLDYFDKPWTGVQKAEWFDVLAYTTKRGETLQQQRFYLKDLPEVESILSSSSPTIIENIAETDLLSEPTRRLFLHGFGSMSTLFVPLTVGGQWLGFINALFEQPRTFNERDIRRLMAIANQAAVAVQGIRLLEQATVRARREEMLRSIAAKVRSSADVDVVMRTAAREIGKALGRETFVYLDQTGNGTLGQNGEDA